MEKQKSLQILERCLKELENMTPEEFDKICKEKGINENDYDSRKYIDNEITIIL